MFVENLLISNFFIHFNLWRYRLFNRWPKYLLFLLQLNIPTMTLIEIVHLTNSIWLRNNSFIKNRKLLSRSKLLLLKCVFLIKKPFRFKFLHRSIRHLRLIWLIYWKWTVDSFVFQFDWCVFVHFAKVFDKRITRIIRCRYSIR